MQTSNPSPDHMLDKSKIIELFKWIYAERRKKVNEA